MSPRKLIRVKSGIVILDGGPPPKLVLIDTAGKLDWSAQLPRGTVATDVEARRDSIFVIDAEQHVIDVFEPHGQHVSTTRLRDDAIEAAVPLKADALVGIAPLEHPAFYTIDSLGRPSIGIDVAWPGFYKLNPLIRSGLVVQDAKSDVWVFATTMGNSWFAFDGSHPRLFQGTYIDAAAPPAVVVDSSATQVSAKIARNVDSILSAALVDDTLYLLRGLSDSLRGKVVDIFSAKSGHYVASYRLPLAARHIAVDDVHMYVITSGAHSFVVLNLPR